ncbi:2-oxoacid:acceptor oxidoreductase family protein [Stappia sp.]|uniref:2-oxoacid:acceptor oxidoreductase family protein n=1 Tax=Stappia sp. TaxID=1870903 RepID=UPI0032D8F4F5
MSEREPVAIRIATQTDGGARTIAGRLGVDASGSGAASTAPRDPATAFQVRLSEAPALSDARTLDALAVFDAPSLARHLPELKPAGLLVIDRDVLAAVRAAGDPSLDGYALLDVPGRSVARMVPASNPDASHAGDTLRLAWALGLLLWLYGLETASSQAWLEARTDATPERAALELAALKAGYDHGAMSALPRDLGPVAWPTGAAPVSTPGQGPRAPGTWRMITGGEALAFGLLAGAQDLGLDPAYCSANGAGSGHVHAHLTALAGETGLRLVPCEDVASAVHAAFGAAFAGALALVATRGPGLAAASDGLGLAVAAELPLVLVHTQQVGPSAGIPPLGAQGDLLAARGGRTGDAPCPVLAARGPAHAFAVAREAVRMAVAHMTPVIVLAEADLLRAAEPFRIPQLPPASPPTPAQAVPERFRPYDRDPRTLARPWAVPGTPGGAHRVGGLERHASSGAICLDPDNHARMRGLRHRKVQLIAEREPEVDLAAGLPGDDVLFVGWGGTHATIATAVARLRRDGVPAAHLHLEMLHPLPRGLAPLVRAARHVLVPEGNAGQLVGLIRAACLVDAVPVEAASGVSPRAIDLETAARACMGEAYA